MGVVTVDVPKRLRSPRAPLRDADAKEAIKSMLRGEAVAPDGLRFDERRLAQTEAWRWRHLLAEMGGIDPALVKSSTWGGDANGWQFAVYLDEASEDAPGEAASAG